MNVDKEPRLDPPDDKAVMCYFCGGEGEFKRCDGETDSCDPCDGSGWIPWDEAETDAKEIRAQETLDRRLGK